MRNRLSHLLSGWGARRWTVVLALALLGLTTALAACGDDEEEGPAPTTAATETPAGPEELVGTFGLNAGACSPGAGVTEGSFFRMLSADGVNYMVNNDSQCEDQTYTPLSPGTDGGLVTGAFQPHADPAFDADGNSLSGAIHAPQTWFGLQFGAATAADVVPGEAGPPSPPASAPTITHDPTSGALSGDVSAVSIGWQGLYFSQGNPRANDPDDLDPDGAASDCPDDQSPLTGTYDAASGAYSLDWSSRIGGSFGCDFIGFWHLEGTFTPGG